MRNCHDLFTRCEAVTVISDHQPQNRVGTARCAVRAAFSGATIPPAISRAGTSQRDIPTTVRFMGGEGRVQLHNYVLARRLEFASATTLAGDQIRQKRIFPRYLRL